MRVRDPEWPHVATQACRSRTDRWWCRAREPREGDPRLSLVVPDAQRGGHDRGLPRRRPCRVLERLLPGAYELIVVDDDSPDGTWRKASRCSARYPALRVLRREGETGLSSAVVRGWQLARGGVLGVIDADLQHPPEVCAALWAEMARGADLAVASRHVPGGGVSEWSLRRRILSRGRAGGRPAGAAGAARRA